MRRVLTGLCVVMLAAACASGSQPATESASPSAESPDPVPEGSADDWHVRVVNESGTAFSLWVGFLGFDARHRLGEVHHGATEEYRIAYHEHGVRFFISDNADNRKSTSNAVEVSKGGIFQLTVDQMFQAHVGQLEPSR